MSSFAEAKRRFDEGPGKSRLLPRSLVPVDGMYREAIHVRNANGNRLEEYYKWQFLYALINSGLYSKDYLGTEVRFPKGNKASAPIKLDAAIFDDPGWVERYQGYWQ